MTADERLARYECLVHARNRDQSYGTPVSVLASSVRTARERAIALGWSGDARDARVTILSVVDEPASGDACQHARMLRIEGGKIVGLAPCWWCEGMEGEE